jgi:hypothetical protein
MVMTPNPGRRPIENRASRMMTLEPPSGNGLTS